MCVVAVFWLCVAEYGGCVCGGCVWRRAVAVCGRCVWWLCGGCLVVVCGGSVVAVWRGCVWLNVVAVCGGCVWRLWPKVWLGVRVPVCGCVWLCDWIVIHCHLSITKKHGNLLRCGNCNFLTGHLKGLNMASQEILKAY